MNRVGGTWVALARLRADEQLPWSSSRSAYLSSRCALVRVCMRLCRGIPKLYVVQRSPPRESRWNTAQDRQEVTDDGQHIGRAFRIRAHHSTLLTACDIYQALPCLFLL